MKRLVHLTVHLGGVIRPRGADPEVGDVRLDSRRVAGGDLFAALPGNRDDGARFVADAVARGAAAVLTPHELDRRVLSMEGGPPCAQWVHPDARGVAGRAAALLQGEPSRRLAVAGITGTNGKTTTAHLLGGLLERARMAPAVFGTAGHRLAGGQRVEATHTTPDGPELQRLLRRHVEAGGRSAVMEVSSHALVQERTAGIDFAVAVFTNLTREHLDYHGDMQSYERAKRLLFERLGSGATAVLNADDPAWVVMAEAARRQRARIVTFSTRSRADLRAARLRTTPEGSLLSLDGMGFTSTELRLPLRGGYNVENALAAAAAALVMGAGPSAVAEGLATTSAAPGRLEPVPTGVRGFDLYVDYAHGPAALERVLRLLREDLDGRSGGGRLIVVFGCGGERDRGKRPAMGRIAARLADLCVVTSDNPRSEEPRAIVADILEGMRGAPHPVIVELERGRAIHHAVELARPGDIVLLAGKGHETYQTIGAEVVAFDDRAVAQEALA